MGNEYLHWNVDTNDNIGLSDSIKSMNRTRNKKHFKTIHCHKCKKKIYDEDSYVAFWRKNAETKLCESCNSEFMKKKGLDKKLSRKTSEQYEIN